LHIASMIILELRRYRALRISELDEKIEVRLGENAKYNFLPALNFLFITGVLDYDSTTDAIFLIPNRDL